MPIYMNNPVAGEGQKRSSQGQDAVGRFGPALSAQPGLLGAFGVGGGEVVGFAQSSVLEADVLSGHRLTFARAGTRRLRRLAVGAPVDG